MKSVYVDPRMNVVFVEDSDIVTMSLDFAGDDNASDENQTDARRRNPIWDNDEE